MQKKIPLLGYPDRFSVAPGETITFKVSSTLDRDYDAALVRIRCGDPNPDGPGLINDDLSAVFKRQCPSRFQPVQLGSYIEIDQRLAIPDRFALAATVWPTLPDAGDQVILSVGDPLTSATVSLGLNANGVFAQIGAARISSDREIRNRAWYRLSATFDLNDGHVALSQLPLRAEYGIEDDAEVTHSLPPGRTALGDAMIRIAASVSPISGNHFNGKIEDPQLRAQSPSGPVIARWDFSQAIGSQRIIDQGPLAAHGHTVNLPARAVTGSNWESEEQRWTHAPEQFGAIHFHDDDLYDCNWDDDFSFTVPANFRSGPYAMALRAGDHYETIPFYVRPKRKCPQSRIAVVAPTFTYIVYGNYQRGVTNDEYRARTDAWGARPWNPDEYPQFSLSTYNFHRDGSGVGYASRLRPMINMRPGFLSYVDHRGSGLRHYPADTHLIAWLDQQGFDYDVITDEDVSAEGVGLLDPYRVVVTMSHPEYHTTASHDAYQHYLARGGRVMYLGGNGFYWRVATHEDFPGAVEVRRAEGGIRAWAAEPGEYYHAFDGEYGGLWRRNARPPQSLVGVGFSSQGQFEGTYYQRQAGADDTRAAWIFAGVDDQRLGDFGLSGGGAAGFELDRCDPRLGSPRNAVVLATSVEHPAHFVLVPEELLTHVTTWPGEPIETLIRADMVYFNTASGGEVFSVGSITYCGSLLHNHGENNISQITRNVLARFSAA